ncbi:superinfection exclusion B family protein [Leisingera sp. M527]|uniref:superinfection exclusion B family protein n=1 Tax=Leisingera sp. M527 TaxID=2867014 RepID=UPI0021A30B39|nr:superinfection exclusion B family protein [Leisingera sp. M527]UWQ33841.1 superinfection exclusion B family protein [Leisingera sp. M527]
MPSLKDFVAAMQAGWMPALAAFVGCLSVLAGDYYKLPYLDSAPDWLTTTAAYVGVFAFSILVANLFRLPVLAWKKRQSRRKERQLRARLRKSLDEAPDEELDLLMSLFASGRQSFVATYTDGRLAPLVAKGFLLRSGGQYSVLEWPFRVRNEVWNYLRELARES